MTNLIASLIVTVVTNTVEKIYKPPAIPYGCLVGGCTIDHFKEAADAAYAQQTKTITTTAREITTLSFDWNGPRQVSSERLLWETNVVMKLGWK